MFISKLLLFILAIWCVELANLQNIEESIFNSQWQINFNLSRYDAVVSNDQLIFVSTLINNASERIMKFETVELSNDFCEIAVPSVTPNFVVMYMGSWSLGNGKIIVLVDIRNESREKRIRKFFIVDWIKCSYDSAYIDVDQETDDRGTEWSTVPYYNSFDVFYTSKISCLPHRICRNTYTDAGELLDSKTTSLLASEGSIWLMSSISEINSRSGYFFITTTSNPKSIIVQKLDSNLINVGEITYENDDDISYKSYKGHIIFNDQSEEGNHYLVIDPLLNIKLNETFKNSENAISRDYGFLTENLIFQIVGYENNEKNEDSAISSYIQFIDINGRVKSSKFMKFNDDVCADRVSVHRLKNDLFCIIARCYNSFTNRNAIIKCFSYNTLMHKMNQNEIN